MRRAVLGGSFDPVHRGHVAMAQSVLHAGLADCIHVIPAWLSPFKSQTTVSAKHRLAMVELAFAPEKDVRIETLEIGKEVISYTVDSIEHLASQFPDDPLFLIIGADNVGNLNHWHRIKHIADLASLIVLGRNKQPIEGLSLIKSGFSKSRVFTLPDFDYSVSSTDVRHCLAEGKLPCDGLPPAVAQYIECNGLYNLS